MEQEPAAVFSFEKSPSFSLTKKQSQGIAAFFYITPLILQTLIWPLVRPLLSFFFHLEVRGAAELQSVNRERGVLFVANHSSELDPILIPASLPFGSSLMPMFYTSREASFYEKSGWRRFFYGGLFFRLWGSHRLNSGRHNYEQSLEKHIGILEKGKSLVMFPDGKLISEEAIGTISHGGLGYLFWRTFAVVVPVRIKGAFQTSLFDFLTRKHHVIVTFGHPIIQPEHKVINPPSSDECREFVRSVMSKIARM